MKRNNLAILVLLLLSNMSWSQIDLKFDPVSLAVTKNIKVGLEVGINEQFSIDGDYVYSGRTNIPFLLGVPSFPGKAHGVRVIGKYYFQPKIGLDQFYAGAYMKYRKNLGAGYTHKRGTMGLIGGYKFFMFDKFYMDIAAGLGVRFYSSFQTPVGDFIDDLAGRPVFEDFFNRVTKGAGTAAITSRLAIGYRISGDGKKSRKEQEEIIKP